MAAVIVLMATVTLPLARPAVADSAVEAYLPGQPRDDLMTDVVDGKTWQTGQAVLGGRTPLELGADLRNALAPNTTDGTRWVLLDGMRPDSAGGLFTVVFRVGDRLTWEGYESNQGWTAFDPGLPVLDADLLAGRTVRWSGQARATGAGARNATATMTADREPAGDCVNVRAEVQLPDTQRPATFASRWCRGEDAGIRGWSVAVSRPIAGFEALDRVDKVPDRYDLAATAEQPRLIGQQVDPVRLYRTIGGRLSPYEVPSGRDVVRAGNTMVIADSEGTLTGWVPLQARTRQIADFGLVWRARPGGSIRGLATIGDVTYAGTTGRRVVAYQPTGAVLWSRDLPDAVTGLVTQRGHVLISEASGGLLALDPVTGATLWRQQVGGLDRGPVAGGDPESVVVLTEDAIEVRSLSDGEVRWSVTADRAATEAAVGGSLLVVRSAGWLIARDLTDGSVRWSRQTASDGLVSASNRLVVTYGSTRTDVYDHSGNRLWTAPAAESGTVGDDSVTLGLQDRLERRDVDGRTLTWSLPDGYAVPSTRPTTVSTGIIALQRSSDATTWWLYR